MHSLVQKLSKNNVSNSNIVNDIIGYMASKQYLRKHICAAIENHIDAMPGVRSYFQTEIYGEIKEKFRPWICLQQLDLCATVSF
jgi:hypothetical protein